MPQHAGPPRRPHPLAPPGVPRRARCRVTALPGLALAALMCAPVGVAQIPPRELPVSRLPIHLVGIAKDDADPTRSAGLIRCVGIPERRAAALLRVGDRACDVAEVREIRDEAVVVRNLATGDLETVALPKAGPVSAPRAPAPPYVSRRTAPSAIPPLVETPSPDVVTIELQKELLDRSLANLSDVVSAALASPHFASGLGPRVVDGYELSRITPGGIVDQLGLRDGDVLLDVNGQRLDGLASVTALLAQVRSLSAAKVTVLRSNRKVTFVFSVK
jgi:hypothetical protein